VGRSPSSAVWGQLPAGVVVGVPFPRGSPLPGHPAVRVQAVVAAGLLPAVAWTAQLAGMAYAEGVGWPAELVGGVVVLSALLSALAAGLLAAPAEDARSPA